MSPLVGLELGRVAHLELDNPPLNLVTRELIGQLLAALERLRSAPEVRAVVLCGRGNRAFCAGSHIGEFEAAAPERLALDARVSRELGALPMPTIAAIEGDALGGGLELALCCDLRIASARARLGLPEVRLAVIPGGGGTQRLPRIVGEARAKELILTGRIVTAGEAERMGLVNRVVPAGGARAAADEEAAGIADRGPVAVREAKRLIGQALDTDLDAGLSAELEASERIFVTEDMHEGVRAFFAKREPEFRGQ